MLGDVAIYSDATRDGSGVKQLNETNVNGIGSIYLYYFPSTDEKYVGQTRVGVDRREKEHLHNNQLVDKKMRKHKYCVIELMRCPIEQLNYWETYFIKELKTFKDWNKGGLNLTTGGDCSTTVSDETRRIMSKKTEEQWKNPEYRKRMSDVHIGKTLSEDAKKKLSDAFRGENNPFYNKHHSDETKKKLSDANRGKHHSDETKKKIGDANRGRTRIVSNEMRKKISDAKRGKTLSDEHKKKIGDAGRGRICSDETKKKISDAHRGKTLSDEHRKKLSDAHRGKLLGDANPKRIWANIRRFFKWMDEYCDEKGYIQSILLDE